MKEMFQISLLRSMSLIIGILLIFSVGSGNAQGRDDVLRPFFGIGLGYGSVKKQYSERGINVLGRLGVEISRRFSLALEFESHLINEEEVRCGEFYPGPGGFLAYYNVYKTRYILASVQIYLVRGFYVRPGLGLATHYYADPEWKADDVCVDVEEVSEKAFAVGLSLGYELRVIRHFGLALEGIFRMGNSRDNKSVLGIEIVGTLYL